jgi:hypothetical protein
MSLTIHTNSGLAMLMQSAIAAAKTITAATNADPGVFTSVAHGYSDGDIILIEVDGMPELNERLFQVYAKATDTFQLEDIDGASGIDTTSLGTFISGTAKKLTMGTSVVGVQDYSPAGGDPKMLDTTTVHDTTDRQIVSGASPMSYSLVMQWDPGNAAQQAMLAAYKAAAPKGFKITWPNGRTCMFYGTVGFSGMPGGGKQGVTTTTCAIALEADPTYGS